MSHYSEDYARRLDAALEAALRAKNPTLVASIRAAMRGESYDPLEGLRESMHPETRELLDFE